MRETQSRKRIGAVKGTEEIGRKSGGNADRIARNFLRRRKPRYLVHLLKELAALLLLLQQHTTRYTERTRYKSTYVLSERERMGTNKRAMRLLSSPRSRRLSSHRLKLPSPIPLLPPSTPTSLYPARLSTYAR